MQQSQVFLRRGPNNIDLFLYLDMYTLFNEGKTHLANTRVIWKVLSMAQCVDKMLSNKTFLKTRIQRLLDGLIFVQKGLGVHVQRKLIWVGVYILAEILNKILGNERRKIKDLICDHDLTN